MLTRLTCAMLTPSMVVLPVALASCGPTRSADTGSAPTSMASDPRLLKAATDPANWLTHGGDYAEQRFSALDGINTGNVGRLSLAWSLDLESNRGLEATPLIVDGVLYTSMAWSKVAAVDAATGRQLWFFDPRVPGSFGVKACCDVANRGVAYSSGRIFVGTIDGRLIALDAKTGKEVWSTQTTDRSKSYTITGAPRVAKGKVYIGNGGAEAGVRGYVSAYDEATGKLIWRFYTVPGEPGKPDGAASDEIIAKLAGSTWHGDYWKLGGGGTVWDSIVYDPDLNRLYIGVSNGGPYPRTIRSAGKGDNLFISSVVALDADTGKYIWHYQQTPGDVWDFTSTQQITLADMPVNGRPTKVILHAPKNGFFYVIDRTSGKLISAEKFMPANWAERIDMKTGRPVENPKARYDETGPWLASVGSWGAHSWHPMSFNPKTGLVYIPAQMIPQLWRLEEGFKYRPGVLNMGVDFGGKLPDTPEGIAAMKKALVGKLIAWDPVKQKAAWTVPHESAWNGGTLATAGNLVFQGTSDGKFHAYDAKNGKELWSFKTQASMMPGPVTYAVNGVQYVVVLAGAGSAYNLAMPHFGPAKPLAPGRILAFRINGKAPPLPPLADNSAPLLKPTETFSPQMVAQGETLFTSNCGVCHGASARSMGVVPDLRRSGVVADRETFKQVVIDGMLEERGMVSFRDYLTPAQAESIRAYINSRAVADAEN